MAGVPFTRAYPPGHAKLKTRWHLYLLGMWAIAYVPVRMEMAVLEDEGKDESGALVYRLRRTYLVRGGKENP